jgi:hypothetical protein
LDNFRGDLSYFLRLLVRLNGVPIDHGRRLIDQFMATPFGQKISTDCATNFLGELPAETRVVIMFGLGTGNSYVTTARKAIEKARPG